ncbi:hypothetical protein GCM10009087_18300 [Sphingomonas oligophenolica]
MLAVSVAVVIGAPARAVPSFAQQTGQPCQACHVGGFGPQLTPFGRAFKLGGYTLRTSASIPVSAMAVASFTSTKRAQAAPPADGFDTNNNTAFDQGSIFLAGGIGSHFGGFVQTTYDGVAKSWSWDNLDLRAVGTGKIGGKDLVYGLSINNSPTVQDVWNTLPAWGYPYTSSALAPAPASGPLIAGGLAQNVLGVTAYAWLDSKFYLEAGGYSTPRAGTLRWLGADPLDPGDIHGLAPYGRVAFENQIGGGTLEVGAFLLKADLWPGRDRSAQLTDHYADVGVDASWLRTIGDDTLTLNARYTHEHRSLRATCALGIADGSIDPVPPGDCADGSLHEVRADASYYWHNKIGATIGAFDLAGTANPSLYPDSRTARPDSSGILLQLDGTPFGGNHSPLGQRFNMRVGVQYTAYTRFNGARLNYDGAGANAADNNTVRLFTWIAF